MNRNKFGLSRHIPEKVKREVRQRSRFGCVMCRNAICQYEHIDPIWAEAETHDPNKICLLCGRCHDKVTRGILSKKSVGNAYASLLSSKPDSPFESFDVGNGRYLTIQIGKCTFIGPESIIKVNGKSILSVSYGTDLHEPPKINGIFCDDFGKIILRLEDNIWYGATEAWDITTIGNKISIFGNGHNLLLELTLFPPDKIEVSYLDMKYENIRIATHPSLLMVGSFGTVREDVLGTSGTFYGPTSCIEVTDPSKKRNENFLISSKEGIYMPFSGLVIGKGAETMHIKEIAIWNNISNTTS